MAVREGRSFVGLEARKPSASVRMLDYVMDFCFMVEDRLEELGMTRSELAKRLGRKPSSVSRILSGTANVTLKTIAEYDAALGLDIKLTSGAQADGHVSFSAPLQEPPFRRTWGGPASGEGWHKEPPEQAHAPKTTYRSFSFVEEVAA